jgi:hypothetical protein
MAGTKQKVKVAHSVHGSLSQNLFNGTRYEQAFYL